MVDGILVKSKENKKTLNEPFGFLEKNYFYFFASGEYDDEITPMC